MLTAVLLILAILLVGLLIPLTLVRSVLGGGFRIFVVPGVILHELSHAAACVVTGAQVQRIRVFKRDGGDVAHTKSPIPILGSLLITLAPFLVGFVAVVYLAHLLLPFITHIPNSLNISNFPSLFWFVITSIPWAHPAAWLWLYLILSIGATMTPSWKDFANSAVSIIVLTIILVYAVRETSWQSTINQFAISITPALTLVLFVLCAILAISAVIYLISMIFGITK